MMPVSSLTAMTQRACIRNLAGLRDVADIPYDLLRPILKKIEDPNHLIEVEQASPHIADADAELWRAFIARDVPGWESKIVEPKNKRSWWKVYRKLVREEHKAKQEQEQQLRASLMGLDKEKEANQTKIVHKVIPHTKKEGRFIDGVPNPFVNAWGASKTPALQNAKRGKDIISAIRKQTSLAHKARGLPSAQTIRAKVPVGASQIKVAPQSMVMDHKKYTPTPAVRSEGTAASSTARVFVGRTGPSVQDRAINNALRAEQESKEERLRALTSGVSKTLPAAVQASASSKAVQTNSTKAPVCSIRTMPPPERPDVASAGVKRVLSPAPAPLIRKRPAAAPSMFMPRKKR